MLGEVIRLKKSYILIILLISGVVCASGCIDSSPNEEQYLNQINDHLSDFIDIGNNVNQNLKAEIDGSITEEELITRLREIQIEVELIIIELEATTPPAGYEDIHTTAVAAFKDYDNFLTNYIQYLETGTGLETSKENLESFTINLDELQDLLNEKKR